MGYMIKAMVEAPSSDKMIAIVGMAHLDGIDKYWKDRTFWEDAEFWKLKYPTPNKWEVMKYNRLLNQWFSDNFTRVPRFVPKAQNGRRLILIFLLISLELK